MDHGPGARSGSHTEHPCFYPDLFSFALPLFSPSTFCYPDSSSPSHSVSPSSCSRLSQISDVSDDDEEEQPQVQDEESQFRDIWIESFLGTFKTQYSRDSSLLEYICFMNISFFRSFVLSLSFSPPTYPHPNPIRRVPAFSLFRCSS